jgi:hypothetical protein
MTIRLYSPVITCFSGLEIKNIKDLVLISRLAWRARRAGGSPREAQGIPRAAGRQMIFPGAGAFWLSSVRAGMRAPAEHHARRRHADAESAWEPTGHLTEDPQNRNEGHCHPAETDCGRIVTPGRLAWPGTLSPMLYGRRLGR